jgi:acetyltransferase
MFGSGGQLVEILHDVTLELPPLNTTLARRMLERTKIHRALQGVRGKSSVNIKALQALLIRFSELVLSHPRIAEIEINPLLASDEGLIALDARVVLHPTTISDEQLPRTAIRPYPRQYTFDGRTSDGTVVLIRPIRAEDEPKMVAFHRALSEQSVYLRYFEPLKLEQRIAHEHLSRSCFIDYDRELVLVAEHRSTEGPTILGMGKLTRLADGKTAEFALLVGDAWQRRGLGKQLLERLVQVARSEGLKFVVGCTLASNHPMQRLARKVGFEQCPNVAGHEYDLKLEL